MAHSKQAGGQQSKHIDLLANHVGYRQISLSVTEEEFNNFAMGLRDLVLPLIANEPAPGRKTLMFTTVMMPAPDGKVSPEREGASDDTS